MSSLECNAGRRLASSEAIILTLISAMVKGPEKIGFKLLLCLITVLTS